MFQPIDFKKLIAKNRVLVLIGAIIAFVLGVMCLVSPAVTGGALVWVIIGLIGLFALLSIIKFIFPGKGNKRNGASLALSILLVLCVVGIILVGVFAKDVKFEGETISGFTATTLRLLGFFSIFFGVFSVVGNIFLLCGIGQVEKEERGWAIAKAILGLIVGTLMIIFPFVMFLVSVIIGGVYLVVYSIFLIVLDIKFWNSEKE